MDITTLEQAGETILAPPNLVTPEQRKAAEVIFQELKTQLTLDAAQQIIATTGSQFVLYQIGRLVGEVVLRDWSLLEQPQVECAYKMLVHFAAEKEGLAPYVVAEYLRSAAMIIKRGAIDRKTGDPNELYEFIHKLLSDQEARLQSIGCQLISSLCEQFSSAWRNSKFSITWDFHLAAKTEFEMTGLRRLLEMSVSTLHALGAQSDILSSEFEKRLCEKFLEVAESIFSWNFSSRLFRRIFSLHTVSTSFRPPIAWKDLLENDQFFTLFFTLHSKIRSDVSLALHSMSCLVQLASLSGETMSGELGFAQHFVGLFIENLLALFPEGPLPHERHHFCTIINRLFLYRPIVSLMRLESTLRKRFFDYIPQYMEHLTGSAMHDAIANAEHNDHSALASLYDAWNIMIRGKWRENVPDEDLPVLEQTVVADPTWRVIVAFIRSVQSPPAGNRPIDVKTEDDESEDSDDRKLYLDLFNPLGGFICYHTPLFIDTMCNTLRERLKELSGLMSSGGGPEAAMALGQWKEDMHWLMLIMANSLVGEDDDGTCHVQVEVFENSVAICKQRGSPFDTNVMHAAITQAIEQPSASRAELAGNVDPFIILMCDLIAWCSIEHRIVTESSPEFVSPELCRSSCFALRRWLNAASHVTDLENDPDAGSYPILPIGGPTSDLIVQFVLTKAFTLLNKFSGEEKLCQDAVALLSSLVESRSVEMASSPSLFTLLGSLDIARLPVRVELMKVLVHIAAAANDNNLQRNMFTQIIEPLTNRYKEVCTQQSSDAATTSMINSELTDLLQCFDGVARASEAGSASVLFKVVQPVLETCAPLVSASQSAPVMTAVLTLMQDVTTKIAIYVDNKEDSMMLYKCLLATVDAYRQTHASRFVGMSSDDEEKASDLVLFMEILANVLSKDILDSIDERQVTGSQVAVASLEMLLGLMSESLLEVPDVAFKFYRLILYLTEFSPEAIAHMNEQLLNSLCECLKAGLTSKFGTEITSVCLESLGEVATYFAANRSALTQSVLAQFYSMVPMVFETCLENSCEAAVFSEASSSLFALICFDYAYFTQFVQDLLSRKSNEQAADRLRQAFAFLLPEEPTHSRRERIQFRSRMEKFLNQIQGLLWIN